MQKDIKYIKNTKDVRREHKSTLKNVKDINRYVKGNGRENVYYPVHKMYYVHFNS